jgi:predicted ATPase
MEPGLSRLQVKGYRRLKILDLPLRPFNVLIGANGVGKSSVLEVMDLLAASAEGVLETSISQSGGMSSILTADGKTSAIDLVTQMSVENQCPLEYELRIASKGVGYVVAFEKLTQVQDRSKVTPFKFIDATSSSVHYHDLEHRDLLKPNWDYKWTESALSQVPRMYRTPEAFRELLASSTEIYHTLDVSSRAPVRMPQPMQPADTPGNDGEYLVSCLYSMRENQPNRYEAVEDALRVAFPTFDRISFPPVAAGSMTLAWKDTSLSTPLHPHQLSEGTLRFLWLVTLLQSPGLPKVTLIDEPEVSLHPEMLRLLAELMREASRKTQLIVATHSDLFVRFVNPGEVVVFDLDEGGGTTATRGDQLDLSSWMEEYTLDQLWSMGRLGGRAQLRT